jgi:hypothetical protein
MTCTAITLIKVRRKRTPASGAVVYSDGTWVVARLTQPLSSQRKSSKQRMTCERPTYFATPTFLRLGLAVSTSLTILACSRS